MQELKDKRRSSSGVAPSNVMRLLIKPAAELLEIERQEDTIAAATARQIQEQVSSNAVLQLDVLLSQHQQPPMLYSVEAVCIEGKRGRRIVYSVAAQLPVSFAEQTLGGASMQPASAIKESKVRCALHSEPRARLALSCSELTHLCFSVSRLQIEAKLECAAALLKEIHLRKPSLLRSTGAQPTVSSVADDAASAAGSSAASTGGSTADEATSSDGDSIGAE